MGDSTKQVEVFEDSFFVTDEGEVTADNAHDFDLRYVRRDLTLRADAYFGEGEYQKLSWSERFEKILDAVGAPKQ